MGGVDERSWREKLHELKLFNRESKTITKPVPDEEEKDVDMVFD